MGVNYSDYIYFNLIVSSNVGRICLWFSFLASSFILTSIVLEIRANNDDSRKQDSKTITVSRLENLINLIEQGALYVD